MELSQTQKNALLVKISGKFDTENIPGCEMCGGDWAVDPNIMELREFAKGGVGRVIIPLVSMHCVTCGNSKLFNAISLGAIDERTGEVMADERIMALANEGSSCSANE